MFFVATVAILKFLSLKIMCTHVRQNFWKVSSNSEHHSKPTMNINSQHHNLLGNQISPKSEDFCIWQPFYTLVTMATTAILNLFNPPKAATYYGGYSYKVDHNMAPKPWISIPNIKIYLETKFRQNRRIFVIGGHFVPWLPWQWPPFWIFSTLQKLPHTTVDIPTNFHEVWWKESKFFLNPPFLFPWQLWQSLSNRFRFFLAYLVPLDVDVVPIKFHQFLFSE